MNRRHFLRGLIATPAIVAASSLMPIRGIVMPVDSWLPAGKHWRLLWRKVSIEDTVGDTFGTFDGIIFQRVVSRGDEPILETFVQRSHYHAWRPPLP